MTLSPILVSLASCFAPAEGPFRALDFAKALEEAGRSERVVMVDFFTTWCVPCKKLDKETWPDEDVRTWLAEHTVALKIDAEQERELAKRYEITGYPTMIFIAPDGSERGRIVGFKDPDSFLAAASDVLAGIKPADRLRQQAEKAGWKDPTLRQRLADELVREGEYEEALEHYLWCFDRGLEHSRGYSGVRVSLLLGSVGRLAKQYPPALEALEARRDAAMRALLTGKATDTSATDFASINRELGQPERTLEVYDELASAPDLDEEDRARHRKRLFRHVFHGLLAARRYQEALDGMGSPQGYLQRQRMALDTMKGREGVDESLLAHMRRSAVADGGKAFEALAGANPDDVEAAWAFALEILELDASEATVGLLVEHAERAAVPELARRLREHGASQEASGEGSSQGED